MRRTVHVEIYQMHDRHEYYRDLPDSCSGVYPPEDFEGLWSEHWPNGQLKFRGEYKSRRMRVGQHLSFWENGVLKEISYWDQGYACGTVIWFCEDGSKECEKEYGEHGARIRSWIERTYMKDNGIFSIHVWKADQLIATWTRPELREIVDEVGMDDIAAEAVRELYPDD